MKHTGRGRPPVYHNTNPTANQYGHYIAVNNGGQYNASANKENSHMQTQEWSGPTLNGLCRNLLEVDVIIRKLLDSYFQHTYSIDTLVGYSNVLN